MCWMFSCFYSQVVCDLYGEIVYTKNQPLIHASQNKTMTHHHLLFKQQNTEEIKFLLLN